MNIQRDSAMTENTHASRSLQWRHLFFGLGAALAGFAAGTVARSDTNQRPTPRLDRIDVETATVRTLVITDARGVKRGIFTCNADGSPLIQLIDEEGVEVLHLGLDRVGGAEVQLLNGGKVQVNGPGDLSFATLSASLHSEPELQLSSESGSIRIALEELDVGGNCLGPRDAPPPGGPRIQLYDGELELLAEMRALGVSDTTVRLWGKDASAALHIDAKGSTLRLSDKSGDRILGTTPDPDWEVTHRKGVTPLVSPVSRVEA